VVDHGCNGGYPTTALEYVRTNGVVLESSYPYKGVKGPCKYVPNTGLKYVTSTLTCQDPNYCMGISEWSDLLAQGPMVTLVDAGTFEWQTYKSGIVDCAGGNMNHSVVAYGHQTGVDANGYGTEYISLRNSWGKSWGELGNIRINVMYFSNTCGITQRAWLPKL